MKNQPDLCVFCGESPCNCFKPAPKVRASKKAVAPKPVPKSAPAVVAAPEQHRDLTLEAAINNLLPLIDKRDKPKAEKMLTEHVDARVTRRVTEWKGRHVR